MSAAMRYGDGVIVRFSPGEYEGAVAALASHLAHAPESVWGGVTSEEARRALSVLSGVSESDLTRVTGAGENEACAD